MSPTFKMVYETAPSSAGFSSKAQSLAQPQPQNWPVFDFSGSSLTRKQKEQETLGRGSRNVW